YLLAGAAITLVVQKYGCCIWKLGDQVGIRGAPAPVREVPDATAWEPLKQILQQWEFTSNYAVAVGDATNGRLFTYEGGNFTLKTKIPTGSTSKWPSAMMFAGLVNDGSVSSLDDPIYKYLPWWTKDPKDPRSTVTFRMLLTFTSGFGDGHPGEEANTRAAREWRRANRPNETKAVVARRLAAKPCDQQSGCIIGCAKYIYENASGFGQKEVVTGFSEGHLTDLTPGASSDMASRCLLLLIAGFLALLQALCAVPVSSRFTVPPRRGTYGQEVKRLYHVTEHGEAIRKDGFMIPGDKGSVGGGIYFADSESAAQSKATSLGYLVVADVHVGKALAIDQSSRTHEDWKLSESPWLLALSVIAVVSLVLVGAMHLYEMVTNAGPVDIMDMIDMSDVSPPLGSFTGGDWASCFRSLQEAGYDSVYATGLNGGPEYVVFNEDQVQIVEVRRM
ncbi:unnamed protein product, partial [Symbiodinium sp. CCMP2456]